MTKRKFISALDVVAKFCEAHLSEESTDQKQFMKALKKDFGYCDEMSKRFIEHNFHSILKALKLKSFRTRCKRKSFPSKLFVTPSNVAEPLLYSFFTAILTQKSAFIKYSKYTRSTVKYINDYFKNNFHPYCSKIEIGHENKSIQQLGKKIHSAVIFGEDETIHSVRATLPLSIACQFNGHRISFGLLDSTKCPEKSLKKLAHLAALDVWLYDQRGCCSPMMYFVKGDPTKFASYLHASLLQWNLSYGEVNRNYLNSSERRIVIDRLSVLDETQVKRIYGDIQSNQPIVYESGNRLHRIIGGYQVIGVISFSNESELLSRMGHMKISTQAFSYFGYGAQSKTIQDLKRLLVPSYVSLIGKLQMPTALWNFGVTGL